MESRNNLKDSQIIILGLCIAAATIASTVILSNGLMKVKKFSDQTVSVTGSAEKKIVSDYLVWKLYVSRRDPEMTGAYNKLQEDITAIKGYLAEKGIPEETLILSSISTETIYKKSEKEARDTNEIEAYRLSQTIEVRSSEVTRVAEISRAATELLNQGIELISYAPEYFYTGLKELKIEMLREATKDAKRRAEEIASSSGSKIGTIRAARMGVFQITPVNSYDVSDYGSNDTSSYEKKVNAVVKAEFGIL